MMVSGSSDSLVTVSAIVAAGKKENLPNFQTPTARLSLETIIAEVFAQMCNGNRALVQRKAQALDLKKANVND